MKVRKASAAIAACLITICVLTHIIGPGNRAHHRLQGHDGPVGLGEEPSSWPEAQRRVNERLKSPQTHNTNTNTNTNITFPWVNIPFGTACVRYTTRSKGLQASAVLAPVILVPPCTEILEAFATFTLPSPLRYGVKAQCTHTGFSNLCTLLSKSFSCMLVRAVDKLRIAPSGLGKATVSQHCQTTMC